MKLRGLMLSAPMSDNPVQSSPLLLERATAWSISNLDWLDVVAGIVALAIAMWDLLIIDSSMIGFVLFFMAPPILAVVARLSSRTPYALRRWAIIYLFFAGAGTALSQAPSILPSFQAIHPGGTDFSDKWNRLPLSSRRLITWHMVEGGASIYWVPGYLLFYVDLRRRRLGMRPRLSRPTCYIGLLTMWMIPAFALVVLIMLCLSSH